MSESEAVKLFAQRKTTNSTLADSELEQVAGGCGEASDEKCPKYGRHAWEDTGWTLPGAETYTYLCEQKCNKCGDTRWIIREYP